MSCFERFDEADVEYLRVKVFSDFERAVVSFFEPFFDGLKRAFADDAEVDVFCWKIVAEVGVDDEVFL